MHQVQRMCLQNSCSPRTEPVLHRTEGKPVGCGSSGYTVMGCYFSQDITDFCKKSNSDLNKSDFPPSKQTSMWYLQNLLNLLCLLGWRAHSIHPPHHQGDLPFPTAWPPELRSAWHCALRWVGHRGLCWWRQGHVCGQKQWGVLQTSGLLSFGAGKKANEVVCFAFQSLCVQ